MLQHPVHMNADLTELYRLLHNLIRLGTIVEVDHAAALARVQVGKLRTEWRPWSTLRAGNARTWWAPSVGEQVLFFSPGGDMAAGIIMPSVYSAAYPAPSDNPAFDTAIYPDGAVIQYDHENHALTATLPDNSSATVTASHVTSNAPETTCTGNLTVEKNLTVNGYSALNAGLGVKPGKGGGDTAVINGTMKATEDVVASGISLARHKHGGVQTGSSSTGAPQ